MRNAECEIIDTLSTDFCHAEERARRVKSTAQCAVDSQSARRGYAPSGLIARKARTGGLIQNRK